MFPGYKPYLNQIALKSVIVSIDVPNIFLQLEPVCNTASVNTIQFDKSPSSVARTIDGTIQAGSYFGLSGHGSMVPEIETNVDAPYFGEPLGGV